jgi:hypothetical protein
MRLSRLLGVVALTACGMPLFRAPPPAPQSMSAPPRTATAFAAITWYYGGCDGPCSVYSFAIAASGSARYEGLCNTPFVGRYEATVDSATFTRAARLILSSDFFRSDTIRIEAIGGPTLSVTVLLTDGRRRTVLYGLHGAPYSAKLEALVVRLPWQYAGSAANACALPN